MVAIVHNRCEQKLSIVNRTVNVTVHKHICRSQQRLSAYTFVGYSRRKTSPVNPLTVS